MDDDIKNGLGILSTALGVRGLTANAVGHIADNYFGNPNVDMRSAEESIKKLKGLENISHEQFLGQYINAAGDLARRKVEYTDLAGQRSSKYAGDFVLDSKRRLTDLFSEPESPKVKPWISKLLTYGGYLTGNKKKFDGTAQFLTDAADKARSAAEHASSMEHYDAFRTGGGAAYKQLMQELPNIPFVSKKNGVIVPASAEEGLMGIWANALSKPDAKINDYLQNLKSLGLQGGQNTDFVPFFKELKQLVGVKEGMSPEEIQNLLTRSFFAPGKHSSSFVGHSDSVLNQHLGQKLKLISGNQDISPLLADQNVLERINAAKRTLSAGEVEAVTQDPISRFGKLLMRARMLSAPKQYGRVLDALKIVRKLKHPGVLAGSAVATAGGLGLLLSGRSKEAAILEKKAADDDASSALLQSILLLPGGAAAKSFIEQLSDKGFRKHNPFAEIKGVVLGGNTTPSKPQGGGSFTNQSSALKAGLEAAGISTSKKPAYFEPDSKLVNGGYKSPDGAWYPIEYNLNTKALKDIDFITQVGSHPQDTDIAEAMRRGDIQRYRMFSDFGAGNLKQPHSWLGGRNWMAVHDTPKDYTRFFVPGKESTMLEGGKKIKAIKDNVHTPSIPVNAVFNKTQFADAPKSPLGVFSIGGGAGNFIPFTDVTSGMDSYKYDKNGKPVRNVIDDFVEVFRKKHGGKGEVHIHMGNTPEFNTSASKFILALKDQADKERAALENGTFDLNKSRFKGSKVFFDKNMPQREMLGQFANATDILIMPGSTSAELAAMKGNRLPSIVSLLPDTDNAWMPKHWQGNADALSDVLDSKSVSITDKNRVKALEEAFAHTPTRKHEPINFDAKDIAKAIKKDVVLGRLFNLGKLTAKGGAGVLGLGLGTAGLYNALTSSRIYDGIKNLTFNVNI